MRKKMLEYYYESSVHCVKCNRDIGNEGGVNCPYCGYETLESIIQWIEKNRRFEIKGQRTLRGNG